jgi:hypothetical protein
LPLWLPGRATRGQSPTPTSQVPARQSLLHPDAREDCRTLLLQLKMVGSWCWGERPVGEDPVTAVRDEEAPLTAVRLCDTPTRRSIYHRTLLLQLKMVGSWCWGLTTCGAPGEPKRQRSHQVSSRYLTGLSVRLAKIQSQQFATKRRRLLPFDYVNEWVCHIVERQ